MGGVTRAIFGGGGSRSAPAPQPSGTQVVRNETALPSYVQPFYEEALEEAQSQFQTPKTLFPDSYVVPFSEQTQTGLDRATGMAMQGDPLASQSANLAEQTLRGDFLNAGNPYFTQAFQSLANPVISNVQSQFSRGGRLGSGANQEILARALGDIASPLAFANFQQERENQLKTQAVAPAIRGQQFEDAQKLLNLGQVVEDQQARELQEAITRQQFAQTEPQQRLNDYLRAITGATRGGVTTSTRPIYSSSGGRDSSFLNPALGAFTLFRGLGGLFG